MTVTSLLKRKALRKKNNVKSILILGVGNILLRDEGVGVRIVEKIKNEFPLPDEVEVVDGGTLGLRLVPYLEDREAVFIIDAINCKAKPGEFFQIEAEDIDDIYNARKISPHQIGLREILSISKLQNILPKRICLFGIQPQIVDIGLELSDIVSSKLDELIEKLLKEVTSLVTNMR